MTSAAELIRALGGNERTGMCFCPAHANTKTPALHISEGHTGKPVWKCHAGCSQEAVLAEFKRLGVFLSEQSKMNRTTQQRRTERRQQTEDENERLFHAFRILRSALVAEAEPPKTYFRNRGIKQVPHNAYLLPAAKSARHTNRRYPAVVFPITDGEGLIGAHVTVLTKDASANACGGDGKSVRLTYGPMKGGYIGFDAPNPDEPLIIGEGVETTLAAMQLSGLPGIAAGGTSNLVSIKPPAASNIIIAADNDKPGRKAAAQLAERLEYEGRKVQTALPPVEDTDWNDRLLKADDAAAEWRAALAAAPSSYTEPIAALELGEFMQLEFPERQLLLAPWLPNPGLVMIHAQRGNGKTYFALAVANAVASNTDFCGWSCKQDGRVLYVDGELPGDDLQSRLKKLTAPMPPGQFFVLSRDTFLLRRQTMPDLGDPEGRQELDRIIELCDPKLLILDSKTTLMRSGVENEAESWGPVQDWLLKWRWRGLTVILLHHEGKSGKPRGTSKTEDVLDTMIGLRTNEELSAEGKLTVFDLTHTKHRDYHGEDAAPMQLQFQVVDGRMRWTGIKTKDVLLERVRELLKDRRTHDEIAKDIGKSRQYVTKLAAKLRKPKSEQDVNLADRRGDE